MVHVLRKKRLEKQLSQRLSELILFEVSDSLLQNEIISITRVEVTADFFRASVYFTLLNETHKNRVIKALYRAAPFLSKLLIKRMRIRKIPELKFFYDTEPSWEQHVKKLSADNKEIKGETTLQEDDSLELDENFEALSKKDENPDTENPDTEKLDT